MSSRRKENKQIERQKKSRRLMSRAITCACVLLLVGAIGWLAISTHLNSFILTFEGERISTNYIHMHLNGPIEEPEVQDAAIESMVHYLTLMHHADLAGLDITQEDIDMAMFTVMQERPFWGLPDFIPNEQLAERMARSNVLVPQLFDIHIPPYHPNPADFTAEIAEYIEMMRETYELNATRAQFITSPNFEELSAIADLAHMANEINFAMFVDGNSTSHVPGTDVQDFPINAFINAFGLFDEMEALYALAPGETSQVISIGPDDQGQESFILIHMLERPEVTDQDIEDSFLFDMGETRRHEQFDALVEQWVAQANYTVNRRALNAL